MKTTPCNGRTGVTYTFFKATRCGAKTRSGLPCKAPAVRFKKRCRMHGGSVGSGARSGNQNALKHGFNTAESKCFQKQISELLEDYKQLLAWY